MKTKHFILSAAFLFISIFSFASVQSDTIKVSGNCSSCKMHIEKAAKKARAISANWNMDTKILVVSFDAEKTSIIDIEKKIASAGYDTPDIKATDAAYKSLEDCCQYPRVEAGN